jgi:GT2 family glycosyltransferase
MTDFPLVSIISVNYNQAQLTCEMLASLRRISYPNIEVIIVDNASPTEAPTRIREEFPEVQLICSARNLGFAGGNNLGVAVAKGKYVLFLNNDTEVEPDFLEPLVACFEADPQAGVASPKIIFHGTDRIIQYAGSPGINPWTGRSRDQAHQQTDQGQFDEITTTALAHGAAMMVPMAVIQKVGMMPELYFLYYEEHDWTEMIKRAGYRCYYVGTSTVYHKESMSVGKGSPLKTQYMYRNRLLFIRRNYAGRQKWSGTLFFLLVAVPKHSLTFALRAETDQLRALWRGLGWHLKPHNVHENRFPMP